jgi:hypothetical protein
MSEDVKQFGGYAATTNPSGDKVVSNYNMSGNTSGSEKKSGFPTVYDKLRAELSQPAKVELEKVIPAGKGRPGWGLRVNLDLDLEKLDRWRISARKSKGKEALDMQRYNSLVIASQTLCLVYDGEDFEDQEGNRLNFASQEVIEMLKAYDVHGAIKNFFARDADILKIGGEILEACGYIEDEDEDDPLESELD